jgi:DNA-binding response OmpR family regulator
MSSQAGSSGDSYLLLIKCNCRAAKLLSETLTSGGFAVATVKTMLEMDEVLEAGVFDFLLSDICRGGQRIRGCLRLAASTTVMIVSPPDTCADHPKEIERKAVDCVVWPFDPHALLDSVRPAHQRSSRRAPETR